MAAKRSPGSIAPSEQDWKLASRRQRGDSISRDTNNMKDNTLMLPWLWMWWWLCFPVFQEADGWSRDPIIDASHLSWLCLGGYKAASVLMLMMSRCCFLLCLVLYTHSRHNAHSCMQILHALWGPHHIVLFSCFFRLLCGLFSAALHKWLFSSLHVRWSTLTGWCTVANYDSVFKFFRLLLSHCYFTFAVVL